MNLERPEIKNMVTGGTKFYSVTDSLNVFAPGSQWDGKGAKMYLETEQGREPFADEQTISELIQKLKPPEKLGDFDAILKGVMNVPKPKY
jgi:hypothetical protein